MWHENLLEIIKKSGMTKTQIAEKGNLPYETVKRVVSGVTNNPYIETLDRFAIALGCSLSDILVGTKAVVGTEKMSQMQEEMDVLTAENATIIAERDLLIAENGILKDEVKALNSKVELLTMQLGYKDQIIALHQIIQQERANK
jgi:transcriptional regulator with XRE-family HTH domain